MSDVTLSRRYALSLAILSLLLSGCAGWINHRTGSNPCSLSNGHGSAHPFKPLICIDDRTAALEANPDPAPFFDVESDNGGPSKRPVKVEWYTVTSGKSLKIDFGSNTGCVDPVQCNGQGYCFTHARKQSARTECKYSVEVDGVKRDPIVIVYPCCNGSDIQESPTP